MFRIECDALDEEDYVTLSELVYKGGMRWRQVFGVPRGGLPMARAFRPLQTDSEEDPYLIIDDVLTTGGSMERFRTRWFLPQARVIGLVLFTRAPCPDWITPIFTLNSMFRWE